MKLPKIGEFGWCHGCGKWVKLDEGKMSLPDHKNDKGIECVGCYYSPFHYQYCVRSHEEAIELATFLEDDNDTCLDSAGGGSNVHTLNCADGEHCANTRRKLAKAFAEYYLHTQNVGSSQKTTV